jgi:hypothetical protein
MADVLEDTWAWRERLLLFEIAAAAGQRSVVTLIIIPGGRAFGSRRRPADAITIPPSRPVDVRPHNVEILAWVAALLAGLTFRRVAYCVSRIADPGDQPGGACIARGAARAG